MAIGDQIASIGANTADIAGAQGRAYTLADAMDRNQLNKMTLSSEKQKATDTAAVRDVLKKSDLSTYEGQTKAAAEATKINPQLGMELMKGFQGQKQDENTLTKQQYEIMAAKNDVIGNSALQLKMKHDQLAQAGKNEAEINAAMMPDMINTVQGLMQSKLPDGSPVLNDQDKHNLQQMLGNGYNPQAVDSVVMRSKQAASVLTQKLAERKEQTAEDRQAETERHNQKMEEQGDRRVDQSEERIKITREKVQAAKEAFGGENGNLMAAMAERGVSLPAGFRSKDQQIALLTSLRQRNPNLSVDQIADKIESGQIALQNYKVEGRTAAGIAGKVAYAENEITQTIPLVREASKALPRGEFVPWNKLVQMGAAADSDPRLKKYKAYMTSLSNAYDLLAARGGTDAEKRAHNRELFNTADSPEALEAMLEAVQFEARASGQAAAATMQPANERAPGYQPPAGVNPGPTEIGAHPLSTPAAGGGPAAPPQGTAPVAGGGLKPGQIIKHPSGATIEILP